MQDQVLNYKCPKCSAPLRFGGPSGQLECGSCGNVFKLEAIQQAEAARQASAEQAIQWDTSREEDWGAGETERLRSYSCPSCGAEILVDDTTAATECVYCGNSSIMPGVVQGNFRPDAVIPFKKTKEDAMNAYRALIKGKKLLPRAFASKQHIDKISGVYVPFWLFECDADADLSFSAQRVHTRTTSRERITTTEHFLVLRGGSIGFSGVPVDGSSKFADNLMEAIEPFDTSELKPFDLGYLPGYQAERYDVSAEEAEPRANDRIRTSVVDAFAGTVGGYTGVAIQSANVRLQRGRVLNVLAPVWMLNTQWEGKTYTFAMNGQTGRIVGDLPEDKGAIWKWRAAIFLGGLAGVTAISALLSLTGVI